MRGFNVSNFKSTQTNGILRNNKFLVEVPVPNTLRSLPNSVIKTNVLETQKNLEFYCEAANLPGIGLLTNDVKNYGYGPSEKKPYNSQFTDINLVFVSDSDGDNLRFFHQWFKSIQNFDLRNTMLGSAVQSQLAPFELNYKSDYCVDLKIRVYDEQGNEIVSLTLAEAYPIFVGDIPLNWGDKNNYMRIPVTFSFISWWDDKDVSAAAGLPIEVR